MLTLALASLASLLLLSGSAGAADTGFKFPTTNDAAYDKAPHCAPVTVALCPGNTTRAHLDDGLQTRSRLLAAIAGMQPPFEAATYATFGFVIPAFAPINGIEVVIDDARVDGPIGTSGTTVWEVELSGDAGVTWSPLKATPDINCVTSGQNNCPDHTLGGPTDLWGDTWSWSEFSNATFRARIRGDKTAEGLTLLLLDSLKVKVYYTQPPATITLSPTAKTNPVGTSHTVTATVQDAAGAPSPGIIVRFGVTGSVTTSGMCTTNSSGVCDFTYMGPTTPGTDVITAFADTNGDGDRDALESEPEAVPASKTWVAAAPNTLTLEPPTAKNTVGAPHTVTATVRDIFLNPTPDITVRFTVTGPGNTSGFCVTGANGQCTFTYTSSVPGMDAITAYADTNNNNMHDVGEPEGAATKEWTPPACPENGGDDDGDDDGLEDRDENMFGTLLGMFDSDSDGVSDGNDDADDDGEDDEDEDDGSDDECPTDSDGDGEDDEDEDDEDDD